MLLYGAFAVALAFLDHRVRRFPQHVVTEYIPSVLAGTSGAPAKYRVLMPYGLDGLTRWTGGEPYMVFLVVELLSILLALVALHVLLRNWFTPRAALAGVAGAAALLPITFTNSWAHPDTFPDLALFALGCHFIVRGQAAAMAGVLFVGMFNRETLGFLLVLWTLEHWLPTRSRAQTARLLMLAAVCVGVYFGIRWARGFETYRLLMIAENLQMLKILPPGFDPVHARRRLLLAHPARAIYTLCVARDDAAGVAALPAREPRHRGAVLCRRVAVRRDHRGARTGADGGAHAAGRRARAVGAGAC